MPDRERVLRFLQDWYDCEYLGRINHGEIIEPEREKLLKQAITLLKEQEAYIEHLEEMNEKYGYINIVRCKDCRYATRHCCDSVFGTPLYGCSHVSQIGRDTPAHPEDWFCADGERKSD